MYEEICGAADRPLLSVVDVWLLLASPVCPRWREKRERERRSDIRRCYTVCFGLHMVVWDHNSEPS